jgi:SAM-dependent methyltransferase
MGAIVAGLVAAMFGVACEQKAAPPEPVATSTAYDPLVKPLPPTGTAGNPAQPGSDPAAQPIPTSGSHLRTGLDELKATIRAHAKTPDRLPLLFSTTVFSNEDLAKLPWSADTVIGDIGCGPGALVIWLLVNDVPFKKLYAVDVDPTSLEILDFLLTNYFPARRAKIELVQSRLGDVTLPDQAIDLMVFHDAHFFMDLKPGEGNPTIQACLRSARRALARAGRGYVYESVSVALPRDGWPAMRLLTDPFTRSGFKVVKTGELRNMQKAVVQR